jgi:uridine kinase
MNVALLMSGYLRGFKQSLGNIKTNVLDKFDSVDVYVHITKNEFKQDRYYNPSSLFNDIKLIEEELSPVCLLVENNMQSETTVNSNLYNTWSKLYKLNKIRQQNENLTGKQYDLVIRYRPDMNLISTDVFSKEIKNKLYIPSDSKIDKNKLLHKDDKYICDIFSFGNPELMDKYFDFYNELDSLIFQYGNVSETLLFHHLTKNKIDYELIEVEYDVILSKCNVFGISGDSGSGKSTLAAYLKRFFSNSFSLECDRYHKWERGDSNWETMTHLNPEANYITKMSEDIFSLKMGNSIYQVDYDHETGKFTEEKLIENSDNILVCGLHATIDSLDNKVFDLKIFVDTDDKLKYKWKLKRDVEERGHTEDYVRKQIERRKEDYKNYILPQRNNADIIVNFFEDDQNNTCLRVLVRNQKDISEILNTFNKLGIEFTVSHEDDVFTTLTFLKYIDVNLWAIDKKCGNFYDYIIFIILSIGYKNE